MGICPDCESNEDIMVCGTCGEQTCDHCHTICEQCKDIICVDCEAQDFLCEKCLFKQKQENSNKVCSMCEEKICEGSCITCENCKAIICVDCEEDFLCGDCKKSNYSEEESEDDKNEDSDNEDEESDNEDSDIGSYKSEEVWTYEPYYLSNLIGNLIYKKSELKEKNNELEAMIKNLKIENDSLKEETKNATNNTTDYSKQNITELVNKEFCLMYFKDENSRLKKENSRLKEENVKLKEEVKKLNDCRTQYLDDMALDILEYFHDTNSIKETAKKYDMTIEETMENIKYWDGCSDGLQSAKDYKSCRLEVYGPDSEDEDDDE